MQVLASDKTGTLTLNQLILDKEEIAAAEGMSHEDVLLYAALSARWTNNDAIDKAVTAAVDGGEEVSFLKLCGGVLTCHWAQCGR